MMGSFTADPVPDFVIDALTAVQVTTKMGEQGGFQLNFTMGKNSAFAHLHASGYFDPRRRVIIAVTVNGSTDVLMDGIITKQEFTPSSAAGKSVFSVTGLDLTAIMDFVDLTGIPYEAMPAVVIVELMLAKYAVLGVIPMVIPPPIIVIENPLEEFPKQVGTDYSYIQSLADDCGAVFYLDPGPMPGMSLAYWGPDLSKVFGGTQPAVSINMDASTNVDSLKFTYDGLQATQYFITVIEPHTKLPLPVPVPSLGIIMPTHAANPAPRLKMTQFEPIEHKKPAAAALAVLGKLLETADSVTADGELDVIRYGSGLKARQLVGVRGASDYYDGLYYVRSITHNLKRGEYKQSFSLARDGTGSTIATVAV